MTARRAAASIPAARSVSAPARLGSARARSSDAVASARARRAAPAARSIAERSMAFGSTYAASTTSQYVARAVYNRLTAASSAPPSHVGQTA